MKKKVEVTPSPRTAGLRPARPARTPAVREDGRSSLLLAQIPVEDLLAVPDDDAARPGDALDHRLEVFDAERRAADIGVDGDRHDARGLGAFLVEPLEIVDRAPLELDARMVL